MRHIDRLSCIGSIEPLLYAHGVECITGLSCAYRNIAFSATRLRKQCSLGCVPIHSDRRRNCLVKPLFMIFSVALAVHAARAQTRSSTALMSDREAGRLLDQRECYTLPQLILLSQGIFETHRTLERDSDSPCHRTSAPAGRGYPRSGRYHPKAARHRGKSLPSSTDSKCHAFEKTPILRAFQAIDSRENLAANANQLILFDF